MLFEQQLERERYVDGRAGDDPRTVRGDEGRDTSTIGTSAEP